MRHSWIAVAAVAVAIAGCSKRDANDTSPMGSTPDSSAAASGSATTADNAPASGMPDANPAAAVATGGQPLTDQTFVQTAATSDMFEIASSKIALKRSHNPAVRDFARMMIADHTKTTASLKAAIAKSGEQLSPPNALPDDKQNQLHDLDAAPASGFDKAYMQAQVDGHQAALDLMSHYGTDGANPALKAAAQKTGPLVQTHLDKAKSLLQGLG